jgi:hypothetical protein
MRERLLEEAIALCTRVPYLPSCARNVPIVLLINPRRVSNFAFWNPTPIILLKYQRIAVEKIT